MKRKIEIDWNELMGDNGGEEEPQELEIVATKGKTPPKPLPANDQVDFERPLNDREINEQIERQKALLVKMGPKLHDKGEKIRAKIQQLEDERQRIMLRRPHMDVDGCTKLTRSTSSVKPFDKEIRVLACESDKLKCDGEISRRQRQRRQSPSRKHWSQYNGKHSSHGYWKTLSNEDHKPKVSSPYSLHDDGDKSISYDIPGKRNLEESPSYRTRDRKGQTIINVEEEEPQPVTVTELMAELPEGDDPEFVQICRQDMECLHPEGYLTSPIINFYIRYLQQQASPANRAVSDCHFFNTYFYKKLKEAVSYKGNDKDAFFVKFRRWWKGINLFRKAYILIPIHEDLHWSLVIICIPDKEDESGPVILHLDSLSFHHSRSIFEHVKRFLKEEWDYLNQDGIPSDLPISDKTWNNLTRRISNKQIEVPQQKNDYDCGLFVLFFIQRFIEEAPERLKKNSLEMFDKKWFRPEEASALRVKIRKILIDLFRNHGDEN